MRDYNDKWGFLNKSGNEVIPCQWNMVGWFSEGLAEVRDTNGLWGYINKKGELVIPCQWQYATWFAFGKAVVFDDNGRHTINKKGKIVK